MSTRFANRLRGDGAARPRRYSPISGRRRFRGESGYILVMTALLIVPLIAFTAFAVDVGSWYAVGTKMQRAADEAALAGVIWNGTSSQTGVVNSVAAKNGFTNGTGGVTVTATVPSSNPTQLVVTISSPATQYFSGAFLQGETLTRSATAQYNQPIPMGSPYGQLGSDPDQTGNAAEQAAWGSTGTPGHWLDITGWNTPKSEGNQYTSGTCSLAVNPEWDCSAAGTGTITPGPPNNGDFSNQGYVYQIHYDGSTPGPLNIAIYDPALNQQDDNACDANGSPKADLPSSLTAAQVTTFAGAPFNDANATARYAGGANAYCTGDTAEMPANGDGSVNAPDMVTSYVVRAPVTGKIVSDLTNPAVCGVSFSPHGGTTTAAGVGTYDQIGALTNTANQGLENMPFYQEYRRYVSVCTIASPQVGDYILQIRTNAPVPAMTPVTTATSNSTTQATINTDLGAFNPNPVTTHGHNRYAIEAYFGSNPSVRALQTSVSVAAGGKLPMYVNLGLGSSRAPTSTVFYLAQVGSQYAGSTLELNLWDIGDGADATISVTPPTDNTGTTVPQCSWNRDNNGSEVPLGPLGTGASIGGTGNCTVAGLTTGQFNDRLIQLKIPIPSDYHCTDGTALGCWWKMNYSFPTGNPDDTTTWQAKVLGNPVHLVG